MEGKIRQYYILQELPICNHENILISIILTQMTKKITKATPKKIKRASSMEKCVRDAQDFLKSKPKKVLKTKSMMRTIEEGNKIINKKSISPAYPLYIKMKKIQKKAAKKRRTVPARPSLPAIPSLPAAIPVSTGTTIIRGKSLNAAIKPSKATIFKTSSKDNLPLPAFGFIDVCFCLDATGSMSSELAQVQSTIVTIIKKIESKVRTEGITLRFAIVSYRDHPPQESTYVTQLKDFTDAPDAIDYVNKLQAYGGGDEPQAVHDGLIDACKLLNWVELPGTPMLRYIFHIADAPPHGKEFLNPESKEGCLCGKTTDQIFHEINIRQIHYRLIKVRVNAKLDQMQRIFKKSIVNMDSAQISAAKEMDIRVSDMIIHEILPQG